MYIQQVNETGDHGDFWEMMLNSSSISAPLYNSWRSEFLTWKGIYDDDRKLYITKPDDTTYKEDGISNFPVPPSK